MTIEQREREFRISVNRMIQFPYEMRKEFADYWTEPNKSGTKMKWEQEKTWDLTRRLRRWANSGFNNKNYGSEKAAVKLPVMRLETTPEIAELDTLLEAFRLHPTQVPFDSLARHYSYLKENNLMKPFSKGDVHLIKSSYPDNNEKCRSACVLETLKYYGNKGWTFQMTMELRKKFEPVK